MITGMYLSTDVTDCTEFAFERTWAGTSEFSSNSDGSSTRNVVMNRATEPITGIVFKDGVFICLERGPSSWKDKFVSVE